MRFADWKTRKNQPMDRATMRTVRHFARFRREEDGSLIVFSLFLIIGMLIIGGFGVDLMYYEAQRTRVQATTDRAVLAAAHPKQTPGSVKARKEVVMSYFTSAGLGDYITEDDIDVEASGTASEVSAQARLHVEPILLQFIGGKGFEAVGNASAEQSAGLSEVSLVVDISGSMGDPSSTGQTKMYELKRAAKKFVNILLCNPNKPDQTTDCIMPAGTTSVSLVPYEQQVVAGAGLLKKFRRQGAHDISYCASFYADEFTTTAFNANLDIRQTGVFDGSTSFRYESPNSGRFPCKGKDQSWREITPLSTSHTVLADRIDALEHGGWTSSDIGLKWGVTLLDPSIRSVVTGLVTDKVVDNAFLGRPRNFGSSNSQKVVVLMSDGENTRQPYLYDEYRSGPSRVWIGNDGDTNRMSILYENDPNTDSDDVWFWPFLYNENVWPYRGQFMDHPYGENDGVRYCRDRREWGCNKWGTERGEAKRLSWQEVWLKKRWGWWMKMPKSPTTNAKNDPPGVWINREGQYMADSVGDRRYYTNKEDSKDKRLLALCDKAKIAGITIYTIELETDGGSNGGSVLKECSSGDGYYFKVEGVDLVETFSTIGQNITKLHLTR